MPHYRIDQHADTHQKDQHAQTGNQSNRLGGKGRDSFPRKGEHLFQRILGRTGKAFLAGIVHLIAGVADQRHHTAEEHIHFLERLQPVQCPPAHQPIVSMVEHQICSHVLHHFIKALRGTLFEQGIRLSGTADTVDDVVSGFILCNHLIDRINIVLQIRVQRNGHVAVFFHRHQPRQQSVLVSAVAGKGNSLIDRIFRVKLLDQFPCPVFGAVIHKHDPALFCYFSGSHQRLHFFQQLPCGFRQHFFLIIARNDQV